MDKFFEIQQESERQFLSLKNKEVNKKPSKKRKDDGSKQNRMRNEKTFFCVFYKPLHIALVAARIKLNTQFRSSFFNCL